MEFEYRKVENIEESDKAYITLVIEHKIAYRTKTRKFNVWKIDNLKKQLGEPLMKRTGVKFTTIKNGEFHNLAMIEESELSECFGFGAYTPFRHKQQLECEKCFGSAKKSKIDTELKLVKRNLVEYQYSLGITLTFENSTGFKKLCELQAGDKKHICSWITEKNDHYLFFEISNITDIQEMEKEINIV